ncbi:hypothetical protein [Tolypothrix sp. VBCCA 56010]|uniref:hypothetical protein n=1 Tax=Tolypothrix sp. VBCCA 56010 TaxID=3137731 RepID=UPI003D7ED2E7
MGNGDFKEGERVLGKGKERRNIFPFPFPPFPFSPLDMPITHYRVPYYLLSTNAKSKIDEAGFSWCRWWYRCL